MAKSPPPEGTLGRNIAKLQKQNDGMREMLARKRELQDELKELNKMIDARAVQSRAGLEQHFGGGTNGAVLAQVMGDDRDLAEPLSPSRTLFVCLQCSLEPIPLMALAEREPIPT